MSNDKKTNVTIVSDGVEVSMPFDLTKPQEITVPANTVISIETHPLADILPNVEPYYAVCRKRDDDKVKWIIHRRHVDESSGPITIFYEPEEFTERNLFALSFFRSKHRTKEVVAVLDHLLKEGFTEDEISKLTRQKMWWVKRYCLLTKLDPSVLKFTGPGDSGVPNPIMKSLVELARLPHQVQREIWNKVKGEENEWMLKNHLSLLMGEYRDSLQTAKPVKKKVQKPTEVPAKIPQVDYKLVKKAVVKHRLDTQKPIRVLKLKAEPDPELYGPAFQEHELNPQSPDFEDLHS
jgi:hypothetical protein